MKQIEEIRNELLHALGEIDNRPEESGSPYIFAPGWHIEEDENGDEYLKFNESEGGDLCWICAELPGCSCEDVIRSLIFVGLYYYKGETQVLTLDDNSWLDEEAEYDPGELYEIDMDAILTDSLSLMYDAVKPQLNQNAHTATLTN